MTEADVSAAMDVWARAGSEPAVELPWKEIETALALLPKPDAAMVSDDATMLFLLGPEDVLFTVLARDGRVSVTSTPLNGAALRVSLEWSEPAPGTRSTRWTFTYDGAPAAEPWQTVAGSVSVDRSTGREDLDEREFFARVLASRAGWPSYAQPSAREGAVEEPPAADKQPEPRWRAMTDVWGKPIRPGRR